METLSSTPSQRGPRPYKSRRERPCDLCRSRKVACRIDVAPPCAFCYTQASDCTFEALPVVRKRPLLAEDTDSRFNHDPVRFQLNLESQSSGDPGRPSAFEARVAASSSEIVRKHNELNTNLSFPSSASPSEGSPSSTEQLTSPHVAALESSHGMSARITGDAHALTYFSWDKYDECVVSHTTYRRMRSKNAVLREIHAQPIAFIVGEGSLAQGAEPRIEITELDRAVQDVDTMFSDDQKERLVKLFFEYVYPYFPILSQSWFFSPSLPFISRIKLVPLSLTSALYATTLPFILYDDHLSTTLAHSVPSRSTLYRIAWLAIQNELHAPTLSTLQACLLIQQRGPTNQYVTATPFKASMLGLTVNLANSLGLNHDCSDWVGLPPWERRLRTRLWWAVFSTDCWTSMETCTPPLICCEEYNVRSLLLFSSSVEVLEIPQHCAHFWHLSNLSNITRDIHETFSSVRATAKTSGDLLGSLELARSLRSRLYSWKQRYSADFPLPSSEAHQGEPNGHPALDLAYLVTNVMLFRALLRPLSKPCTNYNSEPADAVFTGALTCCRDAVQFLETTVVFGSVWNSFWHSWSQSNFAVISCFFVQFLMIQTERETLGGMESRTSQEIISLIERWRRAMRNGAGSGGWGHTLMSLALLKLNGMMAKFQEQSKA